LARQPLFHSDPAAPAAVAPGTAVQPSAPTVEVQAAAKRRGAEGTADGDIQVRAQTPDDRACAAR